MKKLITTILLLSVFIGNAQLINVVGQQQKEKSTGTIQHSTEFIIVGASIMRALFLDPQLTLDLITAEYPDENVSLYGHGVNSITTSNLVSTIDGILDNYTYTENKDTYVVVHIGGNDVSLNRPYSSDTNLVQMEDNYNYILDAIESRGFIPILNDLTFRDYDETTYANEDAGSKPYNDNILQPLILSRTANFAFDDGQCYWQLYTRTFNNYDTWFAPNDQVHPMFGYNALRQAFVDTICQFIFTDVAPTKIEKE